MDFSKRHIGPDDSDINKMLSYLGFDSIEQLINATIPDGPPRKTAAIGP